MSDAHIFFNLPVNWRPQLGNIEEATTRLSWPEQLLGKYCGLLLFAGLPLQILSESVKDYKISFVKKLKETKIGGVQGKITPLFLGCVKTSSSWKNIAGGQGNKNWHFTLYTHTHSLYICGNNPLKNKWRLHAMESILSIL